MKISDINQSFKNGSVHVINYIANNDSFTLTGRCVLIFYNKHLIINNQLTKLIWSIVVLFEAKIINNTIEKLRNVRRIIEIVSSFFVLRYYA